MIEPMSRYMNRRKLLQSCAVTALCSAAGVLTGSISKAAEGKPAKIRVGMIGTGHAHATGKLSTVRELSDLYELVGVVEPDKVRQGQMAKHPKYAGVRWLSEAELLSAPGLQAVLVETAVPELVPAALRATAAGLHVHIDKAPGHSLPQFAAVLKQAEAHGKHVQLGYMMRYNPAIEFAVRAVREKWLGEIFEISGVISKEGNAETRASLNKYPGGSMFEIGCHLIDAVVAIMGAPEKVTAFNRQTYSDKLVDNQLAVLEYPSATVSIRSTLVEPEGGSRRQLTICGTNGTIEIRPLEPPKLRMTLKKPAGGYAAGEHEVKPAESAGRYNAQLTEFAEVIRGEGQPRFSAKHDLETHRTVLLASGLPLSPVPSK